MVISMGDGFAGHSASGLAFLLLGNWFAVIIGHYYYCCCCCYYIIYYCIIMHCGNNQPQSTQSSSLSNIHCWFAVIIILNTTTIRIAQLLIMILKTSLVVNYYFWSNWPYMIRLYILYQCVYNTTFHLIFSDLHHQHHNRQLCHYLVNIIYSFSFVPYCHHMTRSTRACSGGALSQREQTFTHKCLISKGEFEFDDYDEI